MELHKIIPFSGDRRKNSTASHADAESNSTQKSGSDPQLLQFIQALSELSASETRQNEELKAEHVIHAVDMFFDTILSSDLCSPAVKNLIGMLQMPVLKSATANGMFFSDARHPARRLIKALYSQASKLDYNSNIDSNPRYIVLHDIVKKLSKEFDGDERLFLRAYFDVCQLS